MATPVGEMQHENEGMEDEYHAQVVLVIDSEEGKREYRYQNYDLAGNMTKRVGYSSGIKIWNSGSTGQGDTMGTLTFKEKTTLTKYLLANEITHDNFKEVE